jgi:hypothetical protein
MAATFPRSPDEVRSDWLTTALRAAGALPADCAVEYFTLTILGEGQGMAGVVARLHLGYTGEPGPASVVAKFSTTSLRNLEVMAAFDVYRREVTFYRDIAGTVGARVPRCYTSEVRNDGRACVLLLEDFPHHRPGDQVGGCSHHDAMSIVAEAAKLHATFWGRSDSTGVQRYDGPHSEIALQATANGWDTMVETFGTTLPPAVRDMRDRYIDALPGLQSWLASEPSTVVHGDLRLDNILFGPPGDPDPVVLIDWQGPLRARGVQDLAYLLTQSLDPHVRREHERSIVRTHVDALAEHGVDYDFEQCWDDYRRAAAATFCVAVAIAGTLDPTHDRAYRFMKTTIERAAAAFDELDLLALI